MIHKHNTQHSINAFIQHHRHHRLHQCVTRNPPCTTPYPYRQAQRPSNKLVNLHGRNQSL